MGTEERERESRRDRRSARVCVFELQAFERKEERREERREKKKNERETEERNGRALLLLLNDQKGN